MLMGDVHPPKGAHVSDRVKLVGLDFGTTTSSAVVALATLRHSATGRVALNALEETFRSEMVFTPIMEDDRIDLASIDRLLDEWLDAGHVQPTTLFGGGALLTGLTAQKDNAPGLVELIRRRLGQTLVATADDPGLESWLAFMGSCVALSREHPDRWILNFDIGGGTTNLALGRKGEVASTGCWFIGARHVQVVPGTYKITQLSRHARAVFTQLGIAKNPGESLSESERDRFLDCYLAILVALCQGSPDLSHGRHLEQAPFRWPAGVADPIVTFSGGVGELVYRRLQGEPWPATTHFGDLGIDLAQRIVASPRWSSSLHRFRPRSAGRATVYGLLQHTTEVSGSTLFLPTPGVLPLVDLPIVGRLHAEESDERIRERLLRARGSRRGAGIQVCGVGQDAAKVRALGQRLARILEEIAFPASQPLVLLVHENVGKVLGQYVTRWGTLPLSLLVIDEVRVRDAHYVQIGLPQHHIVPVSFYGLDAGGDFS